MQLKWLEDQSEMSCFLPKKQLVGWILDELQWDQILCTELGKIEHQGSKSKCGTLERLKCK